MRRNLREFAISSWHTRCPPLKLESSAHFFYESMAAHFNTYDQQVIVLDHTKFETTQTAAQILPGYTNNWKTPSADRRSHVEATGNFVYGVADNIGSHAKTNEGLPCGCRCNDVRHERQGHCQRCKLEVFFDCFVPKYGCDVRSSFIGST